VVHAKGRLVPNLKSLQKSYQERQQRQGALVANKEEGPNGRSLPRVLQKASGSLVAGFDSKKGSNSDQFEPRDGQNFRNYPKKVEREDKSGMVDLVLHEIEALRSQGASRSRPNMFVIREERSDHEED
jgi:hypothetical protein